MTTRAVEIRQRTVAAVALIPVLTFGAILTIPAFVQILGEHYGMTDAALGRLTAAEFLACIVGTYLPNGKSVDELTRWVPWACALAVVANVAGLLLMPFVPLIFIHPLSALGAGVSYAYALKVIDASGRQERNFSLYLAALNLCMLGSFQLLAVLTRNDPAAVFFFYAALSLLALAISLGTRASLIALALRRMVSIEGCQQSRLSARILISVGALAIAYTAYGVIWPFVQLMGVARGFSVQDVANGLSAYAVTAVVGGIAAAAIPQQIHRPAIFSLGLGALLASVHMMYAGGSYALFFTGCALFGFYFNFYYTLHLGIIARADGSGRGIVLCGAAPAAGTMMGSFVAGLLVQGSNYLPLAQTGAALSVVGMAMTLATIARMKPAKRLVSTTQTAI